MDNVRFDVINGVPRVGQKEKKNLGFGAYIFGIGIPRGFNYDKIKIFHVHNLDKSQFFEFMY